MRPGSPLPSSQRNSQPGPKSIHIGDRGDMEEAGSGLTQHINTSGHHGISLRPVSAGLFDPRIRHPHLTSAVQADVPVVDPMTRAILSEMS